MIFLKFKSKNWNTGTSTGTGTDNEQRFWQVTGILFEFAAVSKNVQYYPSSFITNTAFRDNYNYIF
jgi:hypothetical protein